MAIQLIYGSDIKPQNTKIHLKQCYVYKSTKERTNCHGKWYFEATHYSGGSNWHLFGFEMNFGDIYFYPVGDRSNPAFYMPESLSQNNNTRTPLPFSVEDEHTIGVGIDIDEHRFYVFYKNNFAFYDFKMTSKCKRINARVWGANINLTDDNVSVNFGDEPFKYNISGFTPWSKTQARITCYCKNRAISRTIYVVSLLLISS